MVSLKSWPEMIVDDERRTEAREGSKGKSLLRNVDRSRPMRLPCLSRADCKYLYTYMGERTTISRRALEVQSMWPV